MEDTDIHFDFERTLQPVQKAVVLNTSQEVNNRHHNTNIT